MSNLRHVWIWLVVSGVSTTLACNAERPSEGESTDRAPVTIGSVAEEAKLTASVTLGTQLGISVAISGDTLLAGAHRDDVPSEDAGAAFVFERANGIWSVPTRLSVADPAECVFGQAVALDGNTALVSAGAFNCGTRSGAVYVFDRSGGTWSAVQKLIASDATPQGTFGFSLAIQGDTAIIGATARASAYVFVRSLGVWTEQAKLVPSVPAASFGWSVSLDGDSAIVGAQQADGFAGAAFVYARSGTTWTEQVRLVAPAAGFPFFGTSVAMSGDTVLVGSGGPAVVDSGSVHVFTGAGAAWALEATLTPSDGNIGDGFGTSIALQGDVAVIGSPVDYHEEADLSEAGSAYLFARSSGVWTETFKLTASDAAENDEFATSVGMSGNTLAFGAPNNLRRGAAYAFTFTVVPEDADGDGVEDPADECPETVPGEVVDADGCSIAQHCPCAGPSGSACGWRNHGAYVRCVQKTARAYFREGLITRQQKLEFVKSAAKADCGRR